MNKALSLIEYYANKRPSLHPVACIILLLHAFFLPLSTAVTSIVSVCLLLIWLIDQNAIARWRFYFSYPLTFPLFMLIGLTFAGLFYSQGTLNQAASSATQILKLGFIPILAFYLQKDNRYKKYILIAFVAALMLTIFATFLKVYAHVPIGHRTYENNIFKNHIVVSYFMATALFFVIVWFNQYKQHRKALLFMMALIMYYLIFLNTGRIGYIILSVYLSLLAWQRFGIKGIGATTGLFLLLMLFAYQFSDAFAMRIDQFNTELQLYLQGKPATPVGARIEFILNSFKMFYDHPLLGIGTGSFWESYKIYAGDLSVLTDNPHNQYLNNAVELGIIGLMALGWLFISQWKLLATLPENNRLLAQGVFLAFFIGCFFNSWLKNFTECHFYMLMTAYFLPTSITKTAFNPISSPLKAC